MQPKTVGEGLYRQNIYGYGAQLASLFSLGVFNLLMPIVLGPYLFGLLSIAIAVASVAIALFHEAISLQVMDSARRTGASEGIGAAALARICWLGFSLSLVAGSLIALSVPFLGPRLNIAPENLYALYWAAPLAVFMHLMLVSTNLLTAMLKLHWVAAVTLLSGFGQVVFPLTAYFLTHSPFWTVAGMVLSYALVVAGITIPLVERRFPGMLRPALDAGPKWKEVIGDTALYSSSSLFMTITNSALLLLVAAWHSVEHAANFKLALSITLGLCALIPAPKYTVFASFLHLNWPDLSAEHDAGGRDARLKTYLSLITKYAGAVVGILLVGGWVLSPGLILKVYGARYAPAATYVQWLVLALPLQLGLNVLVPLCWAQGKLRRVAITYMVAAAVALGAGSLVAQRSVLWMTWSYLLGLGTTLALVLTTMSSTLRGTFLRRLVKPTLAASMLVVGWSLTINRVGPSLWVLARMGFEMAILYAAILFLLRWFDWHEIGTLWNFAVSKTDVRIWEADA